MTGVLLAYAAGSAVALLVLQEPLPRRLLLAPLWPVGPLAFVLVVGLLLATAVVVRPILGAMAALGGLLTWLALR